MIASIKNMTASASSPTEYNEEKRKRGVASILTVRNCFKDTIEGFIKTYEYLENLNISDIRIKNKGFHLAISPDYNEAMDDQKAVKLAEELMEDLGFKEQPWIMYKHTDTGHTHYHVVSTRVNWKGYAIETWKNRYKLQDSLKNHSEKFNFFPGKNPDYKNDYVPVKRFNLKNGNVVKQLNQLVKEATSYQFSSEEQFMAIMRMLRVKTVKKKYKKGFMFLGTDASGKTLTVPINIDKDGEIFSMIEKGFLRKHSGQSIDNIHAVEDIIEEAFYMTESREAFREYLRGKNIEVQFGSMTKNGGFRQITYIDTRSKTVVEHSEFTRNFKLQQMNEDIVHGNWWEKEKRTQLSKLHKTFYQERKSKQENVEQKTITRKR